ncbi:MAG TPA: hypothetical protein VE640_06860 [Candidatus Bathyarchaeia archaeon]|nr:hypothetical protein [Candidatus Bathyarchaeia archaeon]
MAAPWPRHLALITAIAATVGAACTASVPTGSSVGSAPPSASATLQPSSSVEASTNVVLPGPQPSAAAVSDPPETADGAAGPGCGTGRAGLVAHRHEVPAVLHFGGATIEFTTAFIALRNGTYGADDTIPAGVGLTPNEIAVRVAPATSIVLRGDGLVVTESLVRVVPWSTVSFDGGLGFSPATPVDLPTRLRSDGSMLVLAPLKVGDYMVQFDPHWLSNCLRGDGSAYSRIKVVAP